MYDDAFSWHDTNVKKDLVFAKNISIIVSSKQQSHDRLPGLFNNAFPAGKHYQPREKIKRF